MGSRRLSFAALVFATMLVSGCSTTTDQPELTSEPTTGSAKGAEPSTGDSALPEYTWAPAAVSPECLAAVQAAAAVPGDEEANDELHATAGTCTSVDEWVTAVRDNPGAMGLASADAVDPVFDLAAICNDVPDAPTCVDAARRGLDYYW